jgi:hypothetical protein
MLDDLTTLPAKRRKKRLETLAEDALPCQTITVFDGNPDDGITVALHVDSRRRGDVLDLARVVEDDARVRGTCDWSLLPASGRHTFARLLLRVSFERPVHCNFAVSADVRDHASDPLRAALPLLLAATRLVFVFDGQVDLERSLVWIDAPAAREPILALLAAVGV